MKQKGLSPLVAAVLIIAFTVAVAGLISSWLSTTTKQQTEIVGKSLQYQVNCTKANLGVIEVICSENKLEVSVYNYGPIDLTNISVYVSNGTTLYSNSTCSGSDSIGPGQTKVLTCFGSPFVHGNKLTLVRVGGLCANTVGIYGESSDISC
jgi:flagellin-like protein